MCMHSNTCSANTPRDERDTVTVPVERGFHKQEDVT